jgi:beta-glucosidase-like glycosyl hydrolase
MAFGAARDERLAFEAGRITAIEARALGVQVNFAPVIDVNNNARNPVINTRSFGEDPAAVGALGAAYVRGLQEGGALATLKHFPGHGDTEVDTHLGLAVIRHPRDRLDQVELLPYRGAFAAGAAAVMVGHIEMPALNAEPGTPATLSRAVTTSLLRGELRFDGLIYTDSMTMDAVTELMPAGEAAARAVQAGADVVLHSPDDRGSFTAIKAAVERGDIDRAQLDASVARLLRAKASLGLHKTRLVDVEAATGKVGLRAHQAVADEVSRRAITLITDERGHVPIPAPRAGHLLYLSVLDYTSGWEIGAPSRTFIPELKLRWPNVTAVELSDRTPSGDIDLVRATAARYDAVLAGVFVRTASSSGRMDLAAPLVRLLSDLARMLPPATPYVVTVFGNPYAATFLPSLPAMLLTFDFYDRAEASAVRALAGEASIGGRLPVALPGLFPLGHGLDRPGSPSALVRQPLRLAGTVCYTCGSGDAGSGVRRPARGRPRP